MLYSLDLFLPSFGFIFEDFVLLYLQFLHVIGKKTCLCVLGKIC